MLTDADFKHVAAMPYLDSLILDATPIEAEGLKALQASMGLRPTWRGTSSEWQLSEKGCESRIAAITTLKNLEELELGDTGYHEVVPLKTMNSLRSLTLH